MAAHAPGITLPMAASEGGMDNFPWFYQEGQRFWNPTPRHGSRQSHCLTLPVNHSEVQQGHDNQD